MVLFVPNLIRIFIMLTRFETKSDSVSASVDKFGEHNGLIRGAISTIPNLSTSLEEPFISSIFGSVDPCYLDLNLVNCYQVFHHIYLSDSRFLIEGNQYKIKVWNYMWVRCLSTLLRQ